MVSLCVDNACRAGAHIQMTNGAVTSAKQQGDRMVITVSMPYNKAGPYMGSLLHTHCHYTSGYNVLLPSS